MVFEIQNTFVPNIKNEGFDRGHGLEILRKKISQYINMSFSNFITEDFYIQELIINNELK